MNKLFGIILFFIFSFSSIGKVVSEAKYNPVYNQADLDKLILPFKGLAYKADYHVMAYFNGHDVYESVEAFIFIKDDGYEFKAIMTDHNNRQVDYISSDALKIKGDKGTKITRKSKKTTGEFKLSKNGKDYTFSFKLEDNSKISIYYKGFTKPNVKNGGMTDPEGHSPNVGIPMMLRSFSGIGSKKCYVEIDNKRYNITVDEKISVKPFFTGYKTYLTNEFFFALLPSHITEEGIIYNDSSSREYIIETPLGYNKVTLRHNNEVENIKYYSKISRDPKSYMEINFNPALPNMAALIKSQKLLVDFNISFSNKDEVQISGKVKIEKDEEGTVQLLLSPEYPLWAKGNRQMSYDILLDNDKVNIKAYNTLN